MKPFLLQSGRPSWSHRLSYQSGQTPIWSNGHPIWLRFFSHRFGRTPIWSIASPNPVKDGSNLVIYNYIQKNTANNNGYRKQQSYNSI
jgi:hypothetical protein